VTVRVVLTKTVWPYVLVQTKEIDLQPDETLRNVRNGWTIAEVRYVSDDPGSGLRERNDVEEP
jgi:hypothetical protein